MEQQSLQRCGGPAFKFQTASEPIQALWILAAVATILRVTGLVTGFLARAAVEIAGIIVHRHGTTALFPDARDAPGRRSPRS